MRLELTRRADYAVRAMLALAAEPERLSAATIAARMAIPPGFLPHVMRDLVAAGLASATPGRTGGYRPARDPATISVLDVIEAIEGDGRRRTCVLRNAPCGRDGYCAIHRVFSSAQDALLDELGRAMLTDVGPVPIASGPTPRAQSSRSAGPSTPSRSTRSRAQARAG